MYGKPSIVRLYVGDLHPDVTDSILYSTFAQVGKTLSARVSRNFGDQTSLGYGFVNFENLGDATRAIEKLNYADLMGRPMRIMRCVRDPSLRNSGKGNVFIKNLDKRISQGDLYETFEQFGKVLSCKIASDEAGHSKGYGFVHFEDEECAKTAINIINGKMIHGRIVHLEPFIPKDQRKPKFENCYVKNFSTDLDDEGLRELFAEFGEIKSACIMKDERGKSKGFGFVCFSNPDSAEAAVNTMNNKEINGQPLYVSRAQRKEERLKILNRDYEKHRSERTSQGTNLYVKNLDNTIDDARLKEAFSKYGTITSVKVMLNERGISKGFGFVCFSSSEEAKEALKLHGTLIGSKPVYINLAQRRADRDAMLLAQYKEGLESRLNGTNTPFNVPSVNEQISGNTMEHFYLLNGTIDSCPRWNSIMGGSQVHLGYPGIAADPLSGSNLASPYPWGAEPVAMAQSQLSAQGNLINPQFRGQGSVVYAMPYPVAIPVAGPSDGLVDGQRYWVQSPDMPDQMLVPQQAPTSISSNIKPEHIAQQNVQQGVSATAAGATARKVKAVQPQGIRTMASPVGVERTVVSKQHRVASTSTAQDEYSAIGEAGRSGKGKRFTQAERQALGDKIYEKIVKDEPSLAGKITGIIIRMNGSFVRRVAHSDVELEKAVKEAKAALMTKGQDQAKKAKDQSSQKKN